MMDFRCTFLVVTSGKPSFRSNRICQPNTLRVPVPVRSVLAVPCSYTWRMKSSYWERTGRVVMAKLSVQHPAGIEQALGVQRLLDAAHHRHRDRRLVVGQRVGLERADAVLGR